MEEFTKRSLAEMATQARRVNQLKQENDAFKSKLNKMKSKKNYDATQSLCVLCGKDYAEKDNFNWSCHSHTAEFEWVAKIWWCCGKKDPKARGCKNQKHQNQNDKEKAMQKIEGRPLQPQKRKCQCCKAYGHRETSCPKDPNIRSNKHFEPYDEDERILEILVEQKKFNMDSNMLTLKMLTEFCFDKTSGKKLMSFDDFQYHNMNTKILN